MKPLQGVRVLDLTQILSGPYATQILADLGAEVVKIEQPGGDKARRNGPFHDGHSTYFASVNRGKKSLTLDLKNRSGRGVFYQLARHADVVVENFRPGVAERLGIGFEEVKEINPHIIYAACSGFGHTGPASGRPALDIIIQALAGTMSLTGEAAGPPTRVGFSVGDLGAGLYLAVAILAALYQYRTNPQATFIDVSMLDSQVALLENAFARYFATGQVPGPTGSRHPVIAPFQCFQAQDGPFVVAVSTEAQWVQFAQASGHPELLADERFQTSSDRVRHIDQLEDLLKPTFKTRRAAEWIERFETAGVPVGQVKTVAEAAEDPQLLAREMFSTVHFGSSTLRVVASPLFFNGQMVEVASTVAELNEHQEEVLGEILGYNPEDIARLEEEGAFGGKGT